MARILLLNPPGNELYLRDQHCSSISKTDYYWEPVDLVILSGILSEKNDIHVIDAIISNTGEDDCLREIQKLSPEFIIFLTGIVSWKKDFFFMEKVKQQNHVCCIATGGFLREDYNHIMNKYAFLDAVLFDFTSPSIRNYVDGQRDSLNDMCIRVDGEIIKTPLSHYKTFEIPVPRHELFPLKKYRLPHNRYNPFASVLTNYGCPYHCSFCVASGIDFKYRPVENVISELDMLYNNMGIREIFFKDFTFGVPKKVARQLCEEITARFPKLSWICSSRVNVLDDDLLDLMKKAGCHTIQIGVESGSQELLDNHDKQISVEQVKKVFKSCRERGIRTLAHFILGLPGDTEESIRETIKLAKQIKCGYASFNIATPTYGTALRKKCIENKWISEEEGEFDSSNGFPVIETPYLSKEKLWKLRNDAVFSFYIRPSYIFQKLAEVKSFRELRLLFKEGASLVFSGFKPKE